MKAKAWILTLFICMIGLVGFGNTTPDLVPNSKAESSVCFTQSTDLVSVVNFTMNDEFQVCREHQMREGVYAYVPKPMQSYVTSNYTIEIRPGLNTALTIHNSKLNLQAFNNYLPDKGNFIKTVTQFNYRCARDGLNYSIGNV